MKMKAAIEEDQNTSIFREVRFLNDGINRVVDQRSKNAVRNIEHLLLQRLAISNTTFF